MTEYFDRELLEKLKKWTDRKEILAVKGPRQSGKTTLLKMYRDWLMKEKNVAEDQIIFQTLEDPDFKDKFEKDPKKLMESYITNGKRHYFLLDEVHYAEEIGKKLKLLYDTIENTKFLITGSSSLELTSKTSKYLVGRIFSFHLYPFSFWEFLNAKNKRLAKIYLEKNKEIWRFLEKDGELSIDKDIFLSDLQDPLEEYLRYGSYPEVVKAEDEETKRMVIKNLFNTYIARDIVELLQIKESSELRELVSILSNQLGGITNYTELSNSTGLYYKKIKSFLKILEETYVVEMVKPYHKNLKTELRKNPKVYFTDLGLRNHALGNFLPLENRGDRGEMVENFVYSQMKRREPRKINYWRTEGRAEIDFIYRKGEEATPIEVKYQSLNEPKTSKGFRSHLSTYHPKKAAILTKDFWGNTEVEDTQVKFIPVGYF